MVNIAPKPLKKIPDWITPNTELIFDDGEPLESNRHRLAMNALIDSYQHHRSPATDFYAGGNMFIYYSSMQVMNKDFRGPDFFVVLDVDGLKERQGWVVWEEDDRYPDVIVELMSQSTKKVDTGLKKDLYDRTFKTTDYFVYDPFDPSKLQGWHLINGRYEELAKNDRGWLWSEKLGLWLGSWHGTIGNETTYWARFYRPNGDLVLLAHEAEAQRAEAQRRRAEAESQRAETESQRAEAESQRAETESQRAEAESQRASRLAARLRALGEDPDLI
jgi:Uma2 family endonuclease